MKLYQYQSVTKPLTPPGQESERINCDKWLPQNQPPQSNWADSAKKAATIAILATTVMTNLTPVGNLETIRPDKWLPQIPARIDDIKRQQYLYPSTFDDLSNVLNTSVPLYDDAINQTNPLPIDQKRLQHLYPSVFADTGLVLNTSVPFYDASINQINQPYLDLKRLQHLYPSSFWSTYTPPVAETITVDKWLVPTNQPRFDIPKAQYNYSSTFFVDIAPFVPFVASSDTSVIVFTKQTQYQSQTIVPFFTPAVEAITPDKWLPQIPSRIDDIKRQQYLYPSVFDDLGDVLNTSVPFDVIATYQTNQPLFDRPRTQHTYPSFFPDPFHLLDKEIITPDKWLGQYPNVIFDQKRLQHLYPNHFLTPPQITVASIAQQIAAVTQTSVPYFPRRQEQWNYPTSFYVDISNVTLFVPEAAHPIIIVDGDIAYHVGGLYHIKL